MVTGPLILPPGSIGYRVYYAIQGQPFTQFLAFQSVPFIIATPGLPGTPPERVTAFYPDSNGNFLSAYTMFDWLNEALNIASYVAEGIPDTTGIQAVAGVGEYVIPGTWKKFTNMWFDGFPIAFAGGKDMFYRNTLTGITFLAKLQRAADRYIMELQPQPSQTGGNSTLSSPVAVGDSTINLVSTANFVLQLGVAQIGSEIILYSSINGTQLIGCIRGMGGTVESAWAAGTAVNECNIRFDGNRVFDTPTFYPGSSGATLNVPSGWKRPLIDYIVNKVREAEQSPQEAQRKLQEFSGLIKQSMKGNEQPAGPRQVGGTSYPGDGYQGAGTFRIIVQ
jgi:hypothetical protein